jgi:hypothetical protein
LLTLQNSFTARPVWDKTLSAGGKPGEDGQNAQTYTLVTLMNEERAFFLSSVAAEAVTGRWCVYVANPRITAAIGHHAVRSRHVIERGAGAS